jgi:RNA polymerase sigma-70 factor (ECF subfamily)
MLKSAASDRSLIEQISRGDERAFEHAYDRFGTLVYSIAYHILNDTADAEEVVAEVFLQVWTSAATFDAARASVAAWLCVITRSRALDHARARKRRSRVVDELTQVGLMLPEPAAADAGAIASDLRARVAHCLAGLPPDQRRVIELAYYGGLTHSEIAEKLGEPLGTVKTRIRSALGKLRDTLGAYLIT